MRRVFGICLLCAHSAAAPALPDELEEILVTARKRVESISTIPLAVRAFSGDQLGRASVDGLHSLALLDPGLYFESLWGGGNAAPVLRGQSQPNNAGDNVGVFVDGVYQANRNAVDVELLDFDRVEVIHGPQSAMYGRSTFAGVIDYVARAPSKTLTLGGMAEIGNGGDTALQGWLSGPLDENWSGRVAASSRAFDGTVVNGAKSDARLGGYHRDAATLRLLRSESSTSGWRVDLGARFQRGRSDQPAVSTIAFQNYNCGSRSPSSGLWSYYCGELPLARGFDISTDIPPSESKLSQARLSLSRDYGSLQFLSISSVYSSETRLFRDFDGTALGQAFAVSPGGAGRFVSRLINANIVSLQNDETREWAQEFRLSANHGDHYGWMLGALIARTRDQSRGAFGVARGTLGAGEILASMLPATPFVLGPVSPFNRAVVNDPAREQITQNQSIYSETNLALFAAIDFHWRDSLAFHGEFRSSLQYQKLNSILANFGSSFGDAIPIQTFRDITPRVSLDWTASPRTHLYLSVAKGSRSGGINAIPELLPDERTYSPEFNWTTELGFRSAFAQKRIHITATAFQINWQNTQITGLSNSPTIANLIVTNTAGLLTRGIEGSLDWRPTPNIAVGAGFTHQNPRFTSGSDDPAGRGFCGITAQILVSSFCVVGPPRNGVATGIPVVPYLDGNRPGRAPATAWNLHLDVTTPLDERARLWLRADVAGQGNVFERANDGAVYGARTVANLRLGLEQSAWSLELWARNLTNERYIKAAASRGAAFFSTTPRPLDLIYGEERRYGLTLRFQR